MNPFDFSPQAALDGALGAAVAAVAFVATGRMRVQRRAERERSAEAAEIERLRALFDRAPYAVVAISPDGTVERVNAAMERLCGYRADELIGQPLVDLAPMQDHFEHRGLAASLVGDEIAPLSGTLCPKSEPSLPIDIAAIPIRVDGRLTGAYVTMIDASARVQLEFRESMQRERLAAVAEVVARHADNADEQVQELLRFTIRSLGADGGAVSFESNGELRVEFSDGVAPAVGSVVDFTKTFARLTYGSDQVVAISSTREPSWINDEATRIYGWESYIGTTIHARSSAVGIISIVNAASHRRSAPFDQADRDFVRIVAGLIGASLDRVRSEERLSRRAFNDELTGLPNRAYFDDHLQAVVTAADRHGGNVGLLYVDLDGFKQINDTYGHAAGDEVLRILAARFRSVAREGAFLARIGGDEFAIIAEHCRGNEDAARLGTRLVEAAAAPMLVEGERIALGASVGVAFYPRDARDAESLLRRADEAMYGAKGRGKGCMMLYAHL